MSNLKKLIEHCASLSPELRGKQFEHYCKWFLENDARYKAQLKKVWLWNDWPHNWGRDKGIDLIAETYDGGIWAIQAKAYDESYYITKEDVDKFLSESSRKQISYRLLIATTNLIGINALEVIRGQEKQAGTCLLYDLELSTLDWSELLNPANKIAPKTPKSPRPHQLKAIHSVVNGFTKTNKGQLYMACGTGKTLVGLWVTKELKSQNTLVLVPSISLVSQLYIEWVENSAEFVFEPIFVCSDPTVHKKDDDTDQLLIPPSELGFPITTNVKELLTKFKSNSTRPKVIFATYHSSPVIAAACKIDPTLTFDLTIADEAHRCAGSARSDFATIVREDTIRTTRKLFMTATPKIFSNHVKQKTQEVAYEIVSMDDEHSFGPIFYKLLFSDAIRDGLLTDYRVLISVMDNATYKEYAEKGRFVTFNDHETDARTLATQLLVAKAIKKFDLKKVITFHSRRKSAQGFVQTIEKAMELLSATEKPVLAYKESIFGEMVQSERRKILKKFEELSNEQVGLIANVRCLSEGLDVPALDGVIFVDPKGSEIDIVQAVGRAIRNASDKRIGTIIIPIFVDSVNDEITSLEQSCFKVIWQVVKALRAHDDVLAEELDTIRLELGKQIYKKPAKLTKIIIDLPTGIDCEFSKAVNAKVVDGIINNCSDSWEYQFNLLKEFRQVYPNRWPFQHEKFPEYNNLGHWCSTQRQDFKKKLLGLNRIKLLESINFLWDIQISKWTEQFYILGQFRQIFPDRWPAKREEFQNANKLGVWCQVQRHRFSEGKLEKERINQLNNINFIWDPLKNEWKKQFNILVKFRKYNPERWPIATEKFPDENNLGIWCSVNRRSYSQGTLEPWKFEALDRIQFIWDKYLDDWKRQFEILKEYRALNPTKWPEQRESFPSGNKIGIWCHRQRRDFKDGVLDQWKIEKLNTMEFVWDILKNDWLIQLNILKKFRQLYPNRWPTLREAFPTGNKLGNWCSNQRQSFKENTLELWKINELNNINFIWDHLSEEWEAQLANLKMYRNLYPNRWPRAKEEYPLSNKLGFWCGTQRKDFKKSKLSNDRQQKLNEIWFPWGFK